MPMYQSERLTLTRSLIAQLADLARMGYSGLASADRLGIPHSRLKMWMHVGRKHLESGQPTMQAHLVKAVIAARMEALRIQDACERLDALPPETWARLFATEGSDEHGQTGNGH